MTINKATSLALMTGCRMKRMDDLSGVEFEPTNTNDCVIIHGPDGMEPGVRWNPTAADLTSECWVVMLKTPDGGTRPWYG